MVVLTGSKIQHMHTSVKQSQSLGMGFRCESELSISSSPDTSDLTSYSRHGPGRGSRSPEHPEGTPGHQKGWRCGIRLQRTCVCDHLSYQRHIPGFSSYPRSGTQQPCSASHVYPGVLTRRKVRHSSASVPRTTASQTAACAHRPQTDHVHRHWM